MESTRLHGYKHDSLTSWFQSKYISRGDPYIILMGDVGVWYEFLKPMTVCEVRVLYIHHMGINELTCRWLNLRMDITGCGVIDTVPLKGF